MVRNNMKTFDTHPRTADPCPDWVTLCLSPSMKLDHQKDLNMVINACLYVILFSNTE